jgi:uncharacterized protein
VTTTPADSALTFPCEIPIKIVGRNVTGFRDTALAIVRSHFPDCAETDVSERLSRAGVYLSLTVTVHAETRAQADAVYRDLSTHERILMVL